MWRLMRRLRDRGEGLWATIVILHRPQPILDLADLPRCRLSHRLEFACSRAACLDNLYLIADDGGNFVYSLDHLVVFLAPDVISTVVFKFFSQFYKGASVVFNFIFELSLQSTKLLLYESVTATSRGEEYRDGG